MTISQGFNLKAQIPMQTENLRQRAYLNTIASWIDTGTKMLVDFFLKPIIISLLGVTLFGIWQIIGQLNSYMTTVDLRSGTSVKWYVAKNRTSSDDLDLKKTMTAAVISNLLLLPLYLLAGAIIVWKAPNVANADLEYYLMIRLAASLLVVGFILNQYSFLLQSILTGMNLSFKRMGVKATITILSGLATIAVLYCGYSLPAMAMVGIGVALITGFMYWWILIRNVSWFGFAKVTWSRITGFFSLNMKFMALKAVTVINESIDYVLLGYFAGPKFVTSYAVTRYLVRASSLILLNVNSSITPGLGRLVGEGNYKKLFEARKTLLTLDWFAITIAGCVILIWNKSFVSIWIEESMFVGFIETLLIVGIASLKLVQRIDGSIILMTLDIWAKIIFTGIIGITTILLATILIPRYQTLGLLIAIAAGTAVITFMNSIIAQNKFEKAGFIKEIFFTRKAIICTALLLFSSYAGTHLEVHNWPSLIFALTGTTLLVIIFIWFLAMSKDDKTIIISNYKKIRLFRYKEA